ncbi:MAG: hypothetical protein IT530_12065 [Burkholderiales bacterium]|nr:hypothetical protein [Burkholderiales bacterium]
MLLPTRGRASRTHPGGLVAATTRGSHRPRCGIPVAFAFAGALLCACSTIPREELAHYLDCGRPSVLASSTYAVLPPDVTIEVRGFTNHCVPDEATPLTCRSEPASTNAAVAISDALRKHLHQAHAQVVGSEHEALAGARPTIDLRPEPWFLARVTPPCGKPIRDATPKGTGAHFLVFARARDWEASAGRTLGSAALWAVMWPWAFGALATAPLDYAITSPEKRRADAEVAVARQLAASHLVLGVADAGSGEILWIRTVRLAAGTLTSREEVERVVAQAFREP